MLEKLSWCKTFCLTMHRERLKQWVVTDGLTAFLKHLQFKTSETISNIKVKMYSFPKIIVMIKAIPLFTKCHPPHSPPLCSHIHTNLGDIIHHYLIEENFHSLVNLSSWNPQKDKEKRQKSLTKEEIVNCSYKFEVEERNSCNPVTITY